MRIILDTNVLISGLLVAEGPPAKLLDAWQGNLFTVVASEELIVELREVTARPFFKARLRASRVEVLAAGLRDFYSSALTFPLAQKRPTPRTATCSPWQKRATPGTW